MEDSEVVRTDNNGERKMYNEKSTRDQRPVESGKRRICKTLGYLTGEMKACGDWLKGTAFDYLKSTMGNK